MDDIVTKNVFPYPEEDKPDYIIPQEYTDFRYAIGKKGENPLVAICMNPSAASDESSDRTVNRIINVSKILHKDGWIIFNTYPQRATDAKNIQGYDEELANKNIAVIREFLSDNKITEVWAAWGDDNGCVPLRKGKEKLIAMLRSIDVKIYYYGTLTKEGNPRHPLQRAEKCNFIDDNKHYYEKTFVMEG